MHETPLFSLEPGQTDAPLLPPVRAMLPTDRPHVPPCWIRSIFMEPHCLIAPDTAMKVPAAQHNGESAYPAKGNKTTHRIIANCSVKVYKGGTVLYYIDR